MIEKTLEKIQNNSFHIEVFGLGYVGFPLAVRLAKGGFHVTGIDTNLDRVKRLEENTLKDSETNLKDDFLFVRENSCLDLSNEPKKTELPKIGIICVHTPISGKHEDSNQFVKTAIENFLNTSKKGDLIIIESSVSGGTTEQMRKVIEKRGFNVGKDFGLCFCPERIDPQNKKWNLENIPRIIYCSDDFSFKISQIIYHKVNNGNLHRVSSSRVAEVVKSYENAFRLVNISLVNELAKLCDSLGISVSEVIGAASTKPFGFMPFSPSAGAGGHCIPKDPQFLLRASNEKGLTFSTIKNALKINQNIPKYIVEQIEKEIQELNLKKSVLVCGLTYKADVEDMRDSPGFKIIKELSQKNFEVLAYDPYYKPDLEEKYLIENFLKDLNYSAIKTLDEDSLKKISCLCIVQHHSKLKFRIQEIYEKTQVPFIYDCQSKIHEKSDARTVLMSFGETKQNQYS